MLGFESVAIALALTAATPAAQADDLRIRPGQEVWIGRTGGRTLHGRVEDITPDAVTVANAQRTSIPITEIAQIRVRDRLWEGAIAGAAVGSIAGYYAPGRCDDGECIAGPIILYGAIGAGIGAFVDSLIHKRIYPPRRSRQQVAVAPIVGRGRSGMAFQLRWPPQRPTFAAHAR